MALTFIPTLVRPVGPKLGRCCVNKFRTSRILRFTSSPLRAPCPFPTSRFLCNMNNSTTNGPTSPAASSLSSLSPSSSSVSSSLPPSASSAEHNESEASTPTSTSTSSPSPTTSSSMFAESETFASLGLSSEITQSLSDCGFKNPTKAQAAVIPALLTGLKHQMDYARTIREQLDSLDATEDLSTVEFPSKPATDIDDILMFAAETGSGKTLAYLAPFIDITNKHPEIPMKAVVLLPSRELCNQISYFISKYFNNPPKHIILAGGTLTDASEYAASNIRIVLATPKSLLQHLRMSSKPTATSDKFIIVDEADMLLSGNYLKDVDVVLNQYGMKPFATRRNMDQVSKNSNRLLFVGATFPHWTGERVKSIITWMKRRYPLIRTIQTPSLHKRNMSLQSRWFYLNDQQARIEQLLSILKDDCTENDKVMIFCNQAGTAQNLAEIVSSHHDNTIMSKFGGLVQLHKLIHSKTRNENVKNFIDGSCNLVICTDLASRGLDLGVVTRVIEFDFAANVVAYLHRIGRTARAGRGGHTDHFYSDISRPLAEAVREKAEDEATVVESVFSKKRSFRRKLKKRTRDQESQELESDAGNVTSVGLEDVEIDEVDEEERQRWNK